MAAIINTQRHLFQLYRIIAVQAWIDNTGLS